LKYRTEWMSPKPKPQSLRKRIAAAYQVAGPLIMLDNLTEGQRIRLGTLLLDVLAEPERFTAKLIRDLARDAVLP
jgi:hypothetical protein